MALTISTATHRAHLLRTYPSSNISFHSNAMLFCTSLLHVRVHYYLTRWAKPRACSRLWFWRHLASSLPRLWTRSGIQVASDPWGLPWQIRLLTPSDGTRMHLGPLHSDRGLCFCPWFDWRMAWICYPKLAGRRTSQQSNRPDCLSVSVAGRSSLSCLGSSYRLQPLAPQIAVRNWRSPTHWGSIHAVAPLPSLTITFFDFVINNL